MRKVPFVVGEFFHIFNRGVDKRDIFSDKYDAFRFIQSLKEFNRIETGNDIFFVDRNKEDKISGRREPTKNKKLVNIICYCLNPNHFHFLLEEIEDGGISEFMKRLGGYVLYFNEKYKRSGTLFQGRFKAVHIESNEQLLHVSAYVNLNNKVHKKFDGTKKHFLDLIPNRSSWNEYIKKDNKFKICGKDIILGQFKNSKDYEKFAEETIEGIKEKRYED
ncbi:transposase [Candidatus Parcubacteria bacterium]|nr:transposase [Candidatus Parcubacteria bacterium]